MPRVHAGDAPRLAALAVGLALATAGGSALATDYPVTSQVTINGIAFDLPTGGTFGDSTYDTDTGSLSAGQFTLPQGEVSFDSDVGQIVATYRLSQTNTSTGQVGTDGIASLSQATMKLQILSALVGGLVPIPIGTCVFEPIDLFLVGTASSSEMVVSDPAFSVPPVAATDCGGYGDQINALIVGSANAIEFHLAGDFTPPAAVDPDVIFQNGFESSP
ncbi:hypothetical protein [Dokdonella sp.]|uniref:hypothetical protein n=1 Tax=Dokdonella sp. TaxID=2291710 RepID=UPI0031C069EF|nr:hypothetical protein [Dokdonella sp.]